MKNSIFRETSCSPVKVNRCLGGTYHVQRSTSMSRNKHETRSKQSSSPTDRLTLTGLYGIISQTTEGIISQTTELNTNTSPENQTFYEVRNEYIRIYFLRAYFVVCKRYQRSSGKWAWSLDVSDCLLQGQFQQNESDSYDSLFPSLTSKRNQAYKTPKELQKVTHQLFSVMLAKYYGYLNSISSNKIPLRILSNTTSTAQFMGRRATTKIIRFVWNLRVHHLINRSPSMDPRLTIQSTSSQPFSLRFTLLLNSYLHLISHVVHSSRFSE
jgi:hypothetical protein